MSILTFHPFDSLQSNQSSDNVIGPSSLDNSASVASVDVTTNAASVINIDEDKIHNTDLAIENDPCRLYRLQILSSNHRAWCLVYGTHTRSQTFCMMAEDDSGSICNKRFVFVTVQLSLFTDGPKLFVWCTCWASWDVDIILRGVDFPNTPSEDFLSDAVKMRQCVHGDCAIELFCSGIPLSEIGGKAKEWTMPSRVIQHQYFPTTLLYMDKDPLYAVYKDNQWVPGVEDRHGHIRCLICNRKRTYHCTHTNSLPTIQTSSSASITDRDKRAMASLASEELIRTAIISEDLEIEPSEELDGIFDTSESLYESSARTEERIPEKSDENLARLMYDRNRGISKV